MDLNHVELIYPQKQAQTSIWNRILQGVVYGMHTSCCCLARKIELVQNSNLWTGLVRHSLEGNVISLNDFVDKAWNSVANSEVM
jgi:hypothetical protein